MKEERLSAAKTWVVERMEECELKEEKLNDLKKSIDVLLKKFEMEKQEVEDIQKSIAEKLREINSKDRNYEDLSKEAYLLKDQMETWSKELDSREERVEMREQQARAMQRLNEERSEELDDIVEQLDLAHKLSKERVEKLDSKEKQLDAVKKYLNEWFDDLHAKSKQLKNEQKMFEEHCQDLEANQKRFEEQCKDFGSKAEQFEERPKILGSTNEQFEGLSENLASKEKQLERSFEDFGPKEKPLEEPYEKYVPESNKPALDYTNFVNRFGESRIPLLDSTIPVLSPILANMDGKNLLFFLSGHIEVHKLMETEVNVAMLMSSDPGKFVLEAIQAFFSPLLMDVDRDIPRASRSCVFLLEMLLRLAPVISPEVEEAARELAVDWKQIISAANPVITLGFFIFVAAYGLTSAFEPVCKKPRCEEMMNQSAAKVDYLPSLSDEIPAAILCASDPAKLVLDAIKGCYYSKLGSRNICKFISRSFSFFLSWLLRTPLEVTVEVKEQAYKFAADWKEKVKRNDFSEVWCFLLLLAAYKVMPSCNPDELLGLLEIVVARNDATDLLQSLGLKDEIPYLISRLIERGLYSDATRYIYAFGLAKEYPLTSLPWLLEL